MAQTIAAFETPIRDNRGHVFDARACGREREDGLWEGWIEFEDRTTGEVFRTGRETTQPNLTDLKYWATGLTAVYLEGALDRILSAGESRPPVELPPPAFDGPAPAPDRIRHPPHNAVLNPFSVYEKNPDLLVRELGALRAWHLRQIVRDYRLAGEDEVPIDALTEPELQSLIMRRVRELRTHHPPRSLDVH